MFVGIAVFSSFAADDVGTLGMHEEGVKDLKLLMQLPFEEELQITALINAYHASFGVLDETEIPGLLVNEFDRIYVMVVDYLNLSPESQKITAWVIGLDQLQTIPGDKDDCLGGCPRVLAGLYHPMFGYVFYTPEYAKEYYVVHELLHHFIHSSQDEVIQGLPEFITRQIPTGQPIRDFLLINEEEIVVNLSQVIIRKNLAVGFVMEASACVCDPKTVLEPTAGNVTCTCIEAPLSLVAHWIDSGTAEAKCPSCHGDKVPVFDLWEETKQMGEKYE